MESEGSLPRSQNPATGPSQEPESKHHPPPPISLRSKFGNILELLPTYQMSIVLRTD
jgi:hypothetical protein